MTALVVLLISVSCVLLSGTTAAQEDDSLTFEKDGLLYEVYYYGSVMVTGTSDDFDETDLVIPSRVTNEGESFTVSKIGPGAFENHTQLVSVAVPSYSSLEERAFAGCTSLKDINIPSTEDSLVETFAGCTSLESVNLSGNLYNTHLRGTFEGCSSLREVGIRFVASIGDDTFAGCESLTDIEMSHVNEVGDNAFAGCTSLRSLDFGEGLWGIGDGAFAGCTSLVSVTVPDSANRPTIGDRAFEGCESLGSVYIGEGIAGVGDHAFSGCTSVSSLTFLSVCDVGEDAFSDIDRLESLYVRSQGVLDQLKLGGSLSTLTLGGEIIDITSQSAPSLSGIRTLVFEEGVRSIGEGAFQDSRGLDLLAIPDSLESIGGSAFHLDGGCRVAGPEGCLDQFSVADDSYGNLIVYEVSGLTDTADHVRYGWAQPNDEVSPDYEPVGGYTMSVTVDGTEVLGSFEMPTHDVTVGIRYDDGLRELWFYADDILVAYSKARMGEPIPLPEDPSRTPDGDIAYEFQGWYGYEPGMVVTGSESFSAWFVGFVADSSGGEVRYGHMYFGNNLDDAVHVSEECAQDLLSRSVREGLGGVVFEFSHGRMTLGNDDLARIVGDGLTIRMGDLYFDDFRYFVEIGGSDGTVHVDVDIPWRTTVSVPSTVVVQGMDGAPAEVEFNNMWLEGKHYVRFTATESVRCDVKGSDLTMDEGAQIVMYTVILLILVACAVVYLNTRND